MKLLNYKTLQKVQIYLFNKFEENDKKKFEEYKGEIEDTVTINNQQKKIDTQLKEFEDKWAIKIFKFEPYKTIIERI